MTEETFVRELGRRADDVHGVPLTFEDVRSRAHSIRRRRRVGAAAAVAAVAALAIVVPTAFTGGSDRSDGIDPAPQPSVGQGASIMHDRQVARPDGSTTPIGVDNDQVGTFAVLTDGRVVVARTDRQSIEVFAADGTRDARFAVDTTALAVSPTGEVAAWTDESHVVQVLESGTAEPTSLGPVPSDEISSFSVDAVTDDGRVLLGDGNTTSLEATADGVQNLSTSAPFRVWDMNPAGDLWSVTFPPEGDGGQFGCVGLYDPQTDVVTARSCRTTNAEFSPDGQHLVGSRGDNNMAGEVQIFDLDLTETGRYSPAPQVISRYAWADSTHVVAVVAGLDDNSWSVVHVGVDGADPETVDGPVAGGNPETAADFLPSQ